jgi:protein-S-isoprenylcysteine O-methyltransferase
MVLHQPPFELSSVWRRAFWMSWAAWILTELWVFSRDRRAALGEMRDANSRALLVGLISLGATLAFFLAWRSDGWRIAGPAALVFWTGIALIWAGVGLRVWAVRTLGRFFRTVVMLQDDHQLVTRGPYRVLRNPAYTGTLLTLFGLGVALDSWPSALAAAGGALLGYGLRIPVEERALKARFGEAYALWARRTWALIPPIW